MTRLISILALLASHPFGRLVLKTYPNEIVLVRMEGKQQPTVTVWKQGGASEIIGIWQLPSWNNARDSFWCIEATPDSYLSIDGRIAAWVPWIEKGKIL